MQQAATRAQQVPSSAADGNAAPGVLRNGFVINLISSTTPVALKRPEHAGLRRFTFFVSRRREEGRERFRLHMGYFDSQEEAEKLLDIVREIYPGAWAGLAPGRGLRGTPPVAQPPDAAPPARVENAREDAAVQPARPLRVERTNAPAMARGAASVIDRRDRVDVTERHSAAQSLGSVRATIDALEDSAAAAAPAAAMEPKKPRVVPTLRPAGAVPTLKPAITPAPAARAPEATPSKRSSAAAPTPAAVSAARQPQEARPPQSAQAIKEREVLQLLENSARAARKAAAAAAVEKPCFAVQLAWSVEPIDLTRVPQLAIFSAYTLYGAQGHREGRRWYGLRLGFFTDAVSAKQVAQYVRADFATVSVVPVSTRERDQATRAIAGASVPNPASVEPVAGAARPARSTPAASSGLLDEFKFIDDAADVAPVQSGEARGGAAAPAIPRRPSRGAPGKRAVFRAGRVHARSKVKNMTLEQTLEILGANDLAVEKPEKRVVNGDEAVAPVAPAHSKPSKLSRLFERLSERLGT